MATITTGLSRLDNNMTPVLKGVTSSINLSLSAMGDIQDTLEKSFDSSTIDNARTSIQQLEVGFKGIPPSIQDSERQQSKMNNKLNIGIGLAKKTWWYFP